MTEPPVTCDNCGTIIDETHALYDCPLCEAIRLDTWPGDDHCGVDFVCKSCRNSIRRNIQTRIDRGY